MSSNCWWCVACLHCRAWKGPVHLHENAAYRLVHVTLVLILYHPGVCMQASYVGPVIVTVDCKLRSQAGMPLVVPTQTLRLHVQAHVPVQSGAY